MSNINPNNIDGTYPIAGQDNDSQGFRDNFTNIKNNFTYAADEIDDLREKVIVKTALSGTTIDNDMGGSPLSNATFSNIAETTVPLGTVSGAITLSHAVGHYQTATTGGSITSIAFSSFPETGLGRIRLELNVTNTTHTLTLPGAVSIGADALTGSVGNVVTFPSTGKYIYEFTSDDEGTTVAVSEIATPVDNSTGVLTSSATTSSSSLSNIGLGFAAKANGVYKFEALIPFTHSATGTNTHTFSVNFSAGTCNYMVEQAAGPAVAPEVDAMTTSDAADSAVTTVSTSMRFARISGTFTHTSAVTVAMRFATSGGTLTALAGSNLVVTRLA